MAVMARPISLLEFKKLAQKIPCSDQVLALAERELEQGNLLLGADKVSMLPDETYYICQFKYFAKTDPPGLKREQRKFYEQEVLAFSDHTGGVEIRFNCDWQVCGAAGTGAV